MCVEHTYRHVAGSYLVVGHNDVDRTIGCLGCKGNHAPTTLLKLQPTDVPTFRTRIVEELERVENLRSSTATFAAKHTFNSNVF